MMSSGLRPSVEKIVALRSGGLCAFPGCARLLITSETDHDEARVSGQIAHIAGEKPGSPRYDERMTDAERNAAPNLIFLCREHHGDIDNQPATYPIHQLSEWKADHEKRVERALLRELAQLNFDELAQVCNAYVSNLAHQAEAIDLTLTAIQNKVRLNDLVEVEDDVKLGLSRASVVRAFITQQSKVDPRFYEKLKYGFGALYADYRYRGLSPTETYLELVEYARRHTACRSNAPALAIVSSLFEACDIFER
jgi:hypothetical protein